MDVQALMAELPCKEHAELLRSIPLAQAEFANRLVAIEVTQNLHYTENQKVLKRIEDQTTKTNGRVGSLEQNRAVSLIMWAAIGAALVFLAGMMAQHVLTDKVTDLQQLEQKR